MHRFYAEARVVAAEQGFTVALDGKPLRTPAKARLTVPQRALAELLAAEWQAAPDPIDLTALTLSRLVFTALDHGATRRAAMADNFAAYAASDLLCYREPQNAALQARQQELWHPHLDWARQRFDVSFTVTDGIMPVEQPSETVARLRAVADAEDAFGLSGLIYAAELMGSAVLALALAAGKIDAPMATSAAQLEARFQIEQWGEDAEAAARLQQQVLEITALQCYFAALGGCNKKGEGDEAG